MKFLGKFSNGDLVFDKKHGRVGTVVPRAEGLLTIQWFHNQSVTEISLQAANPKGERAIRVASAWKKIRLEDFPYKLEGHPARVLKVLEVEEPPIVEVLHYDICLEVLLLGKHIPESDDTIANAFLSATPISKMPSHFEVKKRRNGHVQYVLVRLWP